MDEESPLAKLHAVLHAARLRKQSSMTRVASRSGLSRTTVSQAFNADTVPSEGTLVALAPVLGLDPTALLRMRQDCLVPRRRRFRTRPRPVPDEDARFEDRYRQYLKNRHGRLTVVGLDLRGPAAANWPLDAAYLSLELTEPDGLGQRVERAERALQRGGPMLVKGLAGSGKTTLIQWIACAAADGLLPGADGATRSPLAFVLPLRTLARRASLPSPEDFLAAVGSPLAGAQPDGWADRVLASGRGIVLVDGLDEVPELMRDRAREWLRELVAAYGAARFVVTTRPTAVADGWLADAGFRELAVRPMSRADVAVFVTRWHTAARAGVADPEVRNHLADLERDLTVQVRAERDLALLTTTPLLCALVCALHRDRRGQLPHDRVELYQAALSMFLYRRDHEREVIAPEGISLNEKESVQLLQKLAYWLIRNGRTELNRATAVTVLADALESMHAVAQQGDADQVLTHLLARSGLLRRPSTDTIDFVHRTFQDFLGAKAAVEALDLPLIARHSHDAQWEDVVRMAVAHARPDERAVLLESLVSRADREPDHRKRLTLLALACLRHATELPAGTREKVQSRAALLLPPTTREEAEELGRVGPLVLDLLPGPGKLTPALAWASVHTAKLVGGDGALAYLKPFSTVADDRTRRMLCTDWEYFDPQEYVAQVLSRVPGELPEVEVAEARQIPALRPLRFSRAALRGNRSPEEVTALPGRERIVSLRIGGNAAVHDLGWLAGAFPALATLALSGCPLVSSLDSLTGSTVSRLRLDDLPLRGLGALAAMPGLRALHLRRLDRLVPDRVPELPWLAELDVDHPRFLDLLDRWPRLSALSAPGTAFLHRTGDVALAHLRRLELWDADLASLSVRRAAVLPQVSEVSLTVKTGELAPLGALFPRARAISVSTVRAGLTADLAPLADLPRLESLTLRGFGTVTGRAAFRPGVVRTGQVESG